MRFSLASPGFKPPAIYLAVLVAAAIYGWLMLVSTIVAPGSIGPNFNALGTDWMVFEAAARATLSGHIAGIFDGDHFTAFLNAQFADRLSAPLPFRPWVYPPSFLALVLPFGFLGFLGSYLLFQALSAAALVGALTIGAPRNQARVIALCVLLCPASAINVIDGQLTFAVAAIFVCGFRLVDARPLLGGAVLGLLTIKPQFALLAPIALIAAGQWRPFLAAAVSAFALAALSAAMFGIEPWLWWFQQSAASIVSPDPKWVEYGRMWGDAVYTCAILLGASGKIASLLQLAALAAGAGAVIAAFRRPLDRDLRLAVLLVATVLAAPHWGSYDTVLLALAGLLWIARTGNESWRWFVVMLFWLVPIVSPPLVSIPGRVVPLLLAAFLVIALREQAPAMVREAKA